MIKRQRALIATILALSLNISVQANDDFEVLDTFIQNTREALNLSYGTVYAIVKDGKIIHMNSYGYEDVKAQKKATKDTVFYIASTTKPIFAQAALLLEQDGKISADTSMSEMFPKLTFEKFNADEVTLKHLLSHTSGIDNDALIYATAYSGQHDKPHRNYLISQSNQIEGKKLGDYQYTNAGYNITSQWYENTFDQNWQEMLNNKLFQPLAMHHTSAYMIDVEKNGWTLAKPYAQLITDDPAQPLELEKQDNTMHAAGGVISTAPDLARYIIAQLEDGKVEGKQIIPAAVIRKSRDKLFTEVDDTGNPTNNGYTWGWMFEQRFGETLYSHQGGFTGMRSLFSFIPAKGIGIVVLSNDEFTGRRFAEAIEDISYNILLETGKAEDVANTAHENITGYAHKILGLIAQDKEQRKGRIMELSLDKKAYAGTYSSPYFGELTIDLQPSGTFKYTWGNMVAVATPYKKPDSMRLELIPNRGWKSVFEINDQQQVTGLNLSGFEFTKD